MGTNEHIPVSSQADAENGPKNGAPNGAEPKRTFRRSHRLSGGPAFGAVYDAKLRRSRSGLTLYVRPSDRAEHRLGLSVGRRVGPANRRVRCKRLLREAFRLERAALPRPAEGGSYDVVAVVRPGAVLALEGCRATLRELVGEAHEIHTRRSRRAADRSEPDV